MRRLLPALSVCLCAGCGAILTPPPPPASNPLTRDFLEKKSPLGQRTGASYDLSQLSLYLRADPPPARVEDLGELRRDLPKLYAAIAAGEVVVHWPGVRQGSGVLAYEKKTLSGSGQVLTGAGISTMTSADLQRALAGG
jgi:hypothetical protein